MKELRRTKEGRAAYGGTRGKAGRGGETGGTGGTAPSLMSTYLGYSLPAQSVSAVSASSQVSTQYSALDTSVRTGEEADLIDSPSCSLLFSPPRGVLEPRETVTVTVRCDAGKLPQRLRATLALLTSDQTQSHDYDTQYCGVRGEIQSPQVHVDKTELALGVTYVGVPVVRYVTLQNLSNLDTKFKWERPAGSTPSFTVAFEPQAGSLTSKQTLPIKVTYTSHVPGTVEDVYACRISGMPSPLGFALKTVSKGVVVGYEILSSGAPVPSPLCPPTSPQYPGSQDDVPHPGPVPTVHVPGITPLFERRTVRFLVRNFSAVPAEFKVHSRTYGMEAVEAVEAVQTREEVAQGEGDARRGSTSQLARRGSTGSLAGGGHTAAARKRKGPKKPLLSNSHETTRVFQTKNGQDHTRARLEYEEDVSILAAGKGCAISVTPSAGSLVPWGVTVVTVRVYNNMPAVYNDEIVCDVKGAPVTRLGFRCKVAGCPLSLRPTSLGLDMLSHPSLPRMKFGEVALSSDPHTRTIAVKNAGPVDALLAWSVREAADDSEDNRAVAVTFDETHVPTNDRPLKLSLGLYEKPRFESPFDITPATAIVPRHGERAFTLTLGEVKAGGEIGDYARWERVMEVLMVADARWQHKKEGGSVTGGMAALAASSSAGSLGGGDSVASGATAGGSLTGTGTSAGGTGTSGTGRRKTRVVGGSSHDDGGSLERETMGAVKLGVVATAIRPWLYLDKRRHGEKLTEDDEDKEVTQAVKFSISATEYKEFIRTKEVSDEMEQTFLLTNRKSIPFEFEVSVEGPYRILSGKTLALPHPNFVAPKFGTAHALIQGLPFILPPNESVELSVGFFPKVTPLSDGSRDDIDESRDMKLEASGRVRVAFATGQEQFVDLKGELIRPLVAVSPSDYHFGTVHVEEHHDIMLFVINPTTVAANYKITHVPNVEPKRKRMVLDPTAELNRAHEDDPRVFEFSEYEGSQHGPTLPLPSAGYCLPDDKNRLHHHHGHGGRPGRGPVFEKTATGLTWKTGNTSDLNIDEKLRNLNAVNPRHPRAITVKFNPNLDRRYRSRFRFEVEEGSGFDVLLAGRGTYEENGKKAPQPRV